MPALVDHPLVRGQVIAHQGEDQHDGVLGDTDAIAIGDFGHRQAPVHRRLQVDMIRPNPRRDRQLQLGRLGDPCGGQVRRPEGL